MIKSMTGFGRGEYSDEKRVVTVEIKSVNHRYTDINVKMPRKYTFAENEVRKAVKNGVKRGKIDVNVSVEAIGDSDIKVTLNTPLAKQYVENLKTLQEELNLEGNITINYVAGMNDVLKVMPEASNEEEIIKSIVTATEKALEAHSQMREIEGAKLAEDLIARGDTILAKTNEIEKRAPKMLKEYMDKLKARIEELIEDKIDAENDRVLFEAAAFADKSNITEEIVRLKSHVAQMNEILKSENAEGKKLDFLIQEMNREANTIGSKANDLETTGVMLDIKGEVEKIREQVQNIE